MKLLMSFIALSLVTAQSNAAAAGDCAFALDQVYIEAYDFGVFMQRSGGVLTLDTKAEMKQREAKLNVTSGNAAVTCTQALGGNAVAICSLVVLRYQTVIEELGKKVSAPNGTARPDLEKKAEGIRASIKEACSHKM